MTDNHIDVLINGCGIGGRCSPTCSAARATA